MIYIDTKNFDIFYDTRDIRIESSLFKVDEFLAPIISLLNKKGYKTKYCCSGHYNNIKFDGFSTPNDSCYIMFKINCIDIIQNIKLPKGFDIEIRDYDFTIRKQYNNNEIERYFEIIDTMKDLYNWTVKLSNCNNSVI